MEKLEGNKGRDCDFSAIEVRESIPPEEASNVNFIKSKPAREIYKPPNLRKSRSGHNQLYQNQQHKFYNNNFGNNNKGYKNSQFQFSTNQIQSRPLNANAKEFQFPLSRNGWNSTGDGSHVHYYQQKSYPLVQSKSSGSMYMQFQKYFQEQQQIKNNDSGVVTEMEKKLEIQEKVSKESAVQHDIASVNAGLEQSKSSGNIRVPYNHQQHRVRFLEDNHSNYFKSGENDQISCNEFMSLKIQANNNNINNKSGESFTPEQQQPIKIGHFDKLSKSKINEPITIRNSCKLIWDESRYTPTGHMRSNPIEYKQGTIKRSKSFGYQNRNSTSSESTEFSKYSINDFEMNKWPAGVIESLKTALNGVERVPARHKIDMVSRIFGTMLGDYTEDLDEFTQQNNSVDCRKSLIGLADFIRPAVHIFHYFIRNEKDQTVMESLINNCIATYQNLCESSGVNFQRKSNKTNNSSTLFLISYSTSTKWIVFLQFLSTFYQKEKIIQLSKCNQGGKSFETDFSLKFLSLVCDCCLVILGFSPVSHTVELMETIFTVMTSLGRDMETKFSSKMKMILASVRDLLLGINYSSDQTLSPHVHKTLMQLIELHAANWQLPASAVRYYYSNTSNTSIN